MRLLPGKLYNFVPRAKPLAEVLSLLINNSCLNPITEQACVAYLSEWNRTLLGGQAIDLRKRRQRRINDGCLPRQSQ